MDCKLLQKSTFAHSKNESFFESNNVFSHLSKNLVDISKMYRLYRLELDDKPITMSTNRNNSRNYIMKSFYLIEELIFIPIKSGFSNKNQTLMYTN